jgi:hypothetical protein
VRHCPGGFGTACEMTSNNVCENVPVAQFGRVTQPHCGCPVQSRQRDPTLRSRTPPTIAASLNELYDGYTTYQALVNPSSEAAEWAAKAYEAGTHTDDPASPAVVAAKTALDDAKAAHQSRT